MQQQDFYKDKEIIITGAASGLGKELACQIHNLGGNVTGVVSPRSDVSSIKFVKKIIKCDLSDKIQIQRLINQPCFGEVDILINCAGIFTIKTIEATEVEEYEYIMNLNCMAPLLLSRACIPFMKRKEEATIINIGSSSCYSGSERSGVYCISKHALLGMSRSLAKELKKYNIRVLMVSPGSIRTKMGKLDTDQDFDTFLDAAEVASYIIFCSSFKKEMIVNETRVNRITTL